MSQHGCGRGDKRRVVEGARGHDARCQKDVAALAATARGRPGQLAVDQTRARRGGSAGARAAQRRDVGRKADGRIGRVVGDLRALDGGQRADCRGFVRRHSCLEQTGDRIRETLEQMKAAGVDSLPGGGAEIFADRVRSIICDHKIDGDQWLDTARLAHEIGLKSNATMLYGHIENDEDRVDHLMKLRALQDETHGFQTFIPLAFHPANTPLEHLPTTTGMLDIKQIAVSRLVLDNFPHIKSYWQMMTAKIAQISLRFGADDMDGTVIEEKIYHDAGATTPQGMRREELERLIRAAGREPIERDTLYRPVTRTETSVTVAV